jgi:hypothetical protein
MVWTTRKAQRNFVLSLEVNRWLDTIPHMERSKTIDSIILQHIKYQSPLVDDSHSTIDEIRAEMSTLACELDNQTKRLNRRIDELLQAREYSTT